MQIKFELIPNDNKNETTTFLSTTDLLKFAMTSKTQWGLFRPLINVRKLLHLVVRGEHEELVSMLEDDISLLYKRGQVIDYSGREFESISAFEYVLWALDKHMWAAMLECVLKNEQANELLQLLLSQYDIINSKGVTFRLNGKLVTQKHFDFQILIKELQKQIDSLNAPGRKDWDAIGKQWKGGVGEAQKLLPIHLVYEYCSVEPFYPLPQFTSKPKSSQQFVKWISGMDENWFCSKSKLGVDFAIIKGAGWAQSCDQRTHSGAWECGCDLDALTVLCKIRTEDFVKLRSQLDQQKNIDDQHQIFQM